MNIFLYPRIFKIHIKKMLEVKRLKISWQKGDIHYNDFEDRLKASVRCASKIFVRGPEKVKRLNVRNIEDEDCPSLVTLYIKIKTFYALTTNVRIHIVQQVTLLL